MSFIQKHNNKFTIQDATMAADNLTLLTPEHLYFLCQKGSLEIIAYKHKWLQLECQPSVWHWSSMYGLLAIPNLS